MVKPGNIPPRMKVIVLTRILPKLRGFGPWSRRIQHHTFYVLITVDSMKVAADVRERDKGQFATIDGMK